MRLGMNKEGMLELQLDHPAREQLLLSVYSTDGKRQTAIRLPEGQDRYTVNLSHLRHGVYAVQLDSQEAGVRGSSLVRR